MLEMDSPPAGGYGPRAELEYQAIFDNAAIGIAYTFDRRFVRCNTRAATMFGYTPAEMAGLPGRAIYPSDESYAEISALATPILSAGQALDCEWQYQRRDGTRFWCHVAARAIDPEHTDAGTVWILDDVSEAHAVREVRDRALMEMNAIMDNASVAILFTRDRRITRYNPRFGEMFGYPGDGAIGRFGRILYRSDAEYEAIGREAGPLLSTGKPFQRELFMRRADGSDVWANLIGYVIDLGDPTRGTIWLIEDRSDFKRAEDALQDNLARLRETNRRLEDAQTQLLQSEKLASIGQLAAGVAHEINNPIGFVSSNMNALLNYSKQLLKMIDVYEQAIAGLSLPPPVQDTLTALRREVDLDFVRNDLVDLIRESDDGLRRVRQIVQDLKDFSHVDSGEWKPIDLNACFASTLNVVRNEIKYKAEVTQELAPLPEVSCNAPQINQVMMNLLVNAAQAIQERGHIVLRSGCDDDWAWFEVADDGPGIPAEVLPRIFDPFFTTKPVGKGTGLGLSVSYGIVSKHGGRIDVDSTPGVGTRFRVWLPIRGVAPADDASSPAA